MVIDSVCPRPDMLADYARFRILDTISLEKQKARFSEVLGYYDCVTIFPTAIQRMQRL